MISVKVTVGGTAARDIRRFQLAQDAKLADFKAKITGFGISCGSAQRLQYLDCDGDFVTVESDAELAEAIALAQLKPTPHFLNFRIIEKKFTASNRQFDAPQVEAAQPRRCSFGFASWCRFLRPRYLIGALLVGVVLFHILAFFAALLGFYALPLLGIVALKIFKQHRRRAWWRARRLGMGDESARSCPFSGSNSSGCPFSSRQTGESQPPAPAAVEPPQPAPAGKLVVAEVTNKQQDSSSLSSSQNVKEKFESLLRTLEEMGFTDRSKNIERLVAARLDLTATIQSLLAQ